MDGCLICGAQHIGSCNPRHPEHRPLSAEQWAEREARPRDSEKETIMPKTAEHDSTPSRWQTLKEQMRPWFSRGAEAAPKQSAAPDREDYTLSDPDEPREPTRRILTREGAVSPGNTIEAARGWWVTVTEVEPPRDPPENQREIRVYGTRGAADERWQDAICRMATMPEIIAAQKAEREQSEPSRRYDLETPGPTEAAGGSFQQFHSKSEAEREASRLPPSQDYRLDRAHNAHGPTDSYVLTTLPSPRAVARDARVEERIRQIEDPEQRARAAALLETIRAEVNASQQQQRARAQERGRELER